MYNIFEVKRESTRLAIESPTVSVILLQESATPVHLLSRAPNPHHTPIDIDADFTGFTSTQAQILSRGLC